MTKPTQPIIIGKKVKKAAHAHHGGAWKIAYADFVTAMMAFFLLMWLISMTTQEQKEGLAEYFAPAALSPSTSGSGGVLMGTEGPHDNVLKLRPPMIFGKADADLLMEVLEETFDEVAARQ